MLNLSNLRVSAAPRDTQRKKGRLHRLIGAGVKKVDQQLAVANQVR